MSRTRTKNRRWLRGRNRRIGSALGHLFRDLGGKVLCGGSARNLDGRNKPKAKGKRNRAIFEGWFCCSNADAVLILNLVSKKNSQKSTDKKVKSRGLINALFVITRTNRRTKIWASRKYNGPSVTKVCLRDFWGKNLAKIFPFICMPTRTTIAAPEGCDQVVLSPVPIGSELMEKAAKPYAIQIIKSWKKLMPNFKNTFLRALLTRSFRQLTVIGEAFGVEPTYAVSLAATHNLRKTFRIFLSVRERNGRSMRGDEFGKDE